MKKINFLNEEQIDLLNSKNWRVYPNVLYNKNWRVYPNANYIVLNKKDFYTKYWEEVCDQLNISTDEKSVYILYIGVQINLED